MEFIVAKAKELGISNTAFIKTKDIIFSAELRSSCEQNVCRQYGTNWMCPPAIGNIEECIGRVKRFENGILLQLFIHMKNSFDYEAMVAGGEQLKSIMSQLKKTIQQEYDKDFIVLGAGGCQRCPECAYKRNEPCLFPDESFSSVEAHGIYVSDIMKKAGMKYTDGPNSIAFVGLIAY